LLLNSNAILKLRRRELANCIDALLTLSLALSAFLRFQVYNLPSEQRAFFREAFRGMLERKKKSLSFPPSENVLFHLHSELIFTQPF
jgi:hypothetical protein